MVVAFLPHVGAGSSVSGRWKHTCRTALLSRPTTKPSRAARRIGRGPVLTGSTTTRIVRLQPPRQILSITLNRVSLSAGSTAIGTLRLGLACQWLAPLGRHGGPRPWRSGILAGRGDAPIQAIACNGLIVAEGPFHPWKADRQGQYASAAHARAPTLSRSVH
jgi:hypothetical protein